MQKNNTLAKLLSTSLWVITLAIITLSVSLLSSAQEIDGSVEVSFKTSKGDFVVELYPEKAPITVKNFVSYVASGYYDNTLFHRVVDGFLVQGGGFNKGMVAKKPNEAIVNESLNGLKNERCMLGMARKKLPDSATSQFYVNLVDNQDLDPRGSQFGYTVFGKVISGMDVIDQLSTVATEDTLRFKNVPVEDMLVLFAAVTKGQSLVATDVEPAQKVGNYIAGKHYIELAEAVETKAFNAIEVVEVFSYGCQHCYSFEKVLTPWAKNLQADVQFSKSPAIWNGLMRLFAHTFYTIEKQPQAQDLHQKIFDQIVIDGRPLLSELMIGKFFSENGVNEQVFAETFDSKAVIRQVADAEMRVKQYQIEGIPAMIVNGKYRVSLASAGGPAEMLKVVDYLIAKEKGGVLSLVD
ncbi:MAG: peptidylprolyl isomerase [Arenicella sp.]|nr:peptidylprolyl isomerase [Arenicella sp.]